MNNPSTLTIQLTSFGDAKIKTIKAVRQAFDNHDSRMSLLEAKDLVESAPVILNNHLPDEICDAKLLRALEEAGARVEVLNAPDPELSAMLEILANMRKLRFEEQVRVARWVNDRFNTGA